MMDWGFWVIFFMGLGVVALFLGVLIEMMWARYEGREEDRRRRSGKSS